MPSGVLGQSFLPLTYPKQLNKVAHTSARALTASRPKPFLQTQRMSPKAQAAASATLPDGATFPSTAGAGSQRAPVHTGFAAGSILLQIGETTLAWSLQRKKLTQRTSRPWCQKWTLSFLTATVRFKLILHLAKHNVLLPSQPSTYRCYLAWRFSH